MVDPFVLFFICSYNATFGIGTLKLMGNGLEGLPPEGHQPVIMYRLAASYSRPQGSKRGKKEAAYIPEFMVNVAAV